MFIKLHFILKYSENEREKNVTFVPFVYNEFSSCSVSVYVKNPHDSYFYIVCVQ